MPGLPSRPKPGDNGVSPSMPFLWRAASLQCAASPWGASRWDSSCRGSCVRSSTRLTGRHFPGSVGCTTSSYPSGPLLGRSSQISYEACPADVRSVLAGSNNAFQVWPSAVLICTDWRGVRAARPRIHGLYFATLWFRLPHASAMPSEAWVCDCPGRLPAVTHAIMCVLATSRGISRSASTFFRKRSVWGKDACLWKASSSSQREWI